MYIATQHVATTIYMVTVVNKNYGKKYQT